MAQPTATDDSPRASGMVRVSLASFIGSAFEWYDFFLYGTAAALVFNGLFFPQLDPMAGTLAAFATFASGFVTRPLGGVVFGHFGDRVGRKSMLVVTMLLMGGSTVAIGFLPTYDSIGVWAPVLLVALRLLQGIGLGGEYAGASLLTVESAPEHQRGFYGSIPQVGVPVGLLLSTGTFALFSGTLMSERAFMAWGWRMPFLLSAVLLFLGLYIRHRVAEPRAFAEIKEAGSEARLPVVEVFRSYPKQFSIAFGARLVDTAASNIFNAFALAYVATQLHLPRSVALTGIMLAAAVEIVLMPLLGALSDRIGRRPVYMAGVVVIGAMAFPFFWMLDTRDPVWIALAIVLGFAFGTGTQFAVQGTFMAELFGTRVRYSGVSLAYQLSAIVGGLMPLIATSLLLSAEGRPWLVSAFLLAVAVVSFACVYWAREGRADGLAGAPDRAAAVERPMAPLEARAPGPSSAAT